MPDEETPRYDQGAFEVERIEGARKVSGPLADNLGDMPANETLCAVVKVNEAGYVPEATDQRARISDTLFTANVRRDLLDALEEDPRVVSVELSERLGLID